MDDVESADTAEESSEATALVSNFLFCHLARLRGNVNLKVSGVPFSSCFNILLQ